MAFPRFLIVGAVNTGLTYVLYLGLLLVIPYAWAYSLTYAVGIGIGYLLNARWVFKRVPSLSSATAYPLTYVLNYLFGVGMLWLFVELIAIPKEIAPLLVVTISAPVMYIVTKSIFLGKPTYEKNNH
jgi:putative flippase GtrA